MKLLILKNNKSRFTIGYKLIQDDQKFDSDVYVQYGKQAKRCNFCNVAFQNGDFQYQPYNRKGIVCFVGQQKKKSIFQVDGDKIINRFCFDASLEIQNGNLIVKAIFAFQESQKVNEKLRTKFETNIRVQVNDKIQKQIDELMRIKSLLQF